MQITASKDQLTAYAKTYARRLKGKNLFYIKQLLRILQLLLKQIQSTESNGLFSITDFLFHAKLDNYNLFKIEAYLTKSRISQKVFEK